MSQYIVVISHRDGMFGDHEFGPMERKTAERRAQALQETIDKIDDLSDVSVTWFPLKRWNTKDVESFIQIAKEEKARRVAIWEEGREEREAWDE